MKTLYLIRHAKSSWDEQGLADKDRPLNDRGKRDALKMSEHLAERGVKPDRIISSPAVRALRTAEAFAETLDFERAGIMVEERLYAAEPETLFEVIAAVDDAHTVVMLFGHHPEISAVVQHWLPDVDHMPTCGVAAFTFKAKRWADVPKAKAESAMLETPKKIR
jgi:phosphohistidine phosphatase